jgi:tryptophan synthase alpha chain
VIEALFARAKDAHRAAFIPYVMAGDPDPETTVAILRALTDAGVDAIELGIPYGDPLADGPTIAAAAQRALNRNTGMNDVLELVKHHKSSGGAPIVLFTYFNPVYQYGIERFAREAANAGASGVIVPDIPLEEGAELAETLANEGLDMPLLVAPSTSRERAEKIAAQSSGFIYVVSRLGVTGAGMQSSLERLRSQLAMMRGITEKPLAVGFGVSSPADVRALASVADGIIVGSALIDAYASHPPAEAAQRVFAFVEPLVGAASFEAV